MHSIRNLYSWNTAESGVKIPKNQSKVDYINYHIWNVFKYIFNIQLIIKLQSDFFKWINQSYQEKMLSVKIYWNLKRNFCYGIYFNKFHAICKGKFQKCNHIYMTIHSHSALIFRLRCILITRKKILHLREEFQHMTIVRIFLLPFFKVQFVFS